MKRLDGKPKKYKNKICSVCKAEFTPSCARSYRCPPCQFEVDRHRNPPAAKKHREKRIKKVNTSRRDLYGENCQLCGRKLIFDQGRKNNSILHHISYEPEVLVIVCRGCHGWMHGNMAIHNNKFKREHEKDMAPYYFARAIVQLYTEGLKNDR